MDFTKLEWRAIIKFWFEEIETEKWFVKDPEFDQLLRDRFGKLLERAANSELYRWREHLEGRLAEVIVLDQFSRNMFRGTPKAFSQDPLALALAQEAIRDPEHKSLPDSKRSFLYMPFMHSESPAIHEKAVELFSQPGLEMSLKFELMHKKIIDQFKRYPHRNEILGRKSSPEELEFLKGSDSSF
jgi:uncharacterized protein (DUF924 family)